MMYSEFIERTGYDENYVTFTDYSDYIEPAYMRLDVDKDKFCKKFVKLYREKISAAVELMIIGHSISELESYICGEFSMSAVESAEKLIQRGFFKELKRKNYDKRLV